MDRLTFLSPLICPVCIAKRQTKNESIVLINLVIGGDHVKGEFRETINLNVKFISGRNIIIIFRISYAQCKNDNDDIMESAVMTLIWDMLKNICARHFLGWTHKDKIQFRIMPHGCNIPPPSAKKIRNVVRPRVFSLGA